jgi:hypothetical protein
VCPHLVVEYTTIFRRRGSVVVVVSSDPKGVCRFASASCESGTVQNHIKSNIFFAKSVG